MSVVWSRQQVVQRTFGTSASIADSVSLVSNEEAMRECHEQRANFDANLSHSCVLCRPVLSSIVIRATTFSHNGPEDDVVR